MGELIANMGAMNSSKSLLAMVEAYQPQEGGKASTILVKPYTDTKSMGKIVTRFGAQEKQVDIDLTDEMSPLDEIERIRCLSGLVLRKVVVDEAQFMQPWQIDEFREFADSNKDDADVVTFGLRTDFLVRLFPGSQRLLEVAHEVRILQADCYHCGAKDANFNARLENDEFVFWGAQNQVDGSKVETEDKEVIVTTYETLCKECYSAQVKESALAGNVIDESVLSFAGLLRRT